MSVDTATPADLAVDYGTAAVLGCAAEPRTDTARVAAFAAAAAVRGRPVLVLSTVATHAVLPAVRYYPAWAMSLLGSRHSAGPADLVGRKTPKTITQTMKSKSHFACFMYSHASPARDALFDLLTDRYKAVTPLGAAKQDRRQAWMPAPVLDRRLANATLTFNDAAVDRYRACKFVIAGESTLLDGYTTEKLVNPMLAAAIPIYYGPPSAAHAFNPASYIDAASLSADDLVAEVARLDRNDTAYRLKLAQPWFAGDALPAWVDVGFLAGVVAPVVPGG